MITTPHNDVSICNQMNPCLHWEKTKLVHSKYSDIALISPNLIDYKIIILILRRMKWTIKRKNCVKIINCKTAQKESYHHHTWPGVTWTYIPALPPEKKIDMWTSEDFWREVSLTKEGHVHEMHPSSCSIDSHTDKERNICFVQQPEDCLKVFQPRNCHGHNAILMWWLIILILHKSFIVCQIQSPQATWAPDFYESTFQRYKSTIHIIFNYVRAGQDHCLYNITGWRKWDSVLLPSELTESRWWERETEKAVLWNYRAATHPTTRLAQWKELPNNCPSIHAQYFRY